jgi:choline-sulfatase
VPSRTSLLTGRYPHELGVYHNEASVNGHILPGDLVTWPQALAQAGYETVSLGKAHTPKHPIWSVARPTPERADRGHRRFGVGREVPPDGVVTPGPPYVVVGGVYPVAEQETTPTTDLTNAALSWLDEHLQDEAPWLLRVSYLMPHTPVMPPRRFAEMFDPADFWPDPALDRPHPEMSPFERFVAEAQQSSKLTAEQVARARAHYWAVVAHVDDEVGRLVAALERHGLRDDTIIVFDSDHGTMLGEMGLWQKQMFIRTVHRVPQIIACPAALDAGQTREDLNTLIDRGPTLLAMNGVDRPAGMRGRDLFGDRAAPEAVYGIIGYGQPGSMLYPLAGSGPETPRRACVRTRTHRYDVSVRLAGEEIPRHDPRRAPCLIDVAADPLERINTSGRPAQAATEARLSEMLEQWLQYDVGSPEPPLAP